LKLTKPKVGQLEIK